MLAAYGCRNLDIRSGSEAQVVGRVSVVMLPPQWRAPCCPAAREPTDPALALFCNCVPHFDDDGSRRGGVVARRTAPSWNRAVTVALPSLFVGSKRFAQSRVAQSLVSGSHPMTYRPGLLALRVPRSCSPIAGYRAKSATAARSLPGAARHFIAPASEAYRRAASCRPATQTARFPNPDTGKGSLGRPAALVWQHLASSIRWGEVLAGDIAQFDP